MKIIRSVRFCSELYCGCSLMGVTNPNRTRAVLAGNDKYQVTATYRVTLVDLRWPTRAMTTFLRAMDAGDEGIHKGRQLGH